MWFVIFGTVWLLLLYFYFIKPLNYWKDRNVKYEKPIPILGNFYPLLSRKTSNIEFFKNIYDKHPNERYVGMYNLGTPMLMLRDPKLFREILVKAFHTFPIHRPTVTIDVDPLWSQNLFAIGDLDKWHRLRSVLSPLFTNVKVKSVFSIMKNNAEKLRKQFISTDDVLTINIKETSVKYAADVLLEGAIGIPSNCLTEPESELYKTVKELNDFSGVKGLMIVFRFFPLLLKVTQRTVISKRIETFFGTLVQEIIKERIEKHVVKKDMIQTLVQAQEHETSNHYNGQKQKNYAIKITDEVILSQICLFSFAGIDTASTVLSYVFYELTINPTVQDKLLNEIDKTIKECNGNVTYEVLVNMTYLDMVVSETLRKCPPFMVVDKQSVKPYTIRDEKTGKPVLFLEKGSIVFYPIRASHWNPEYFPDPHIFDPERFNDENIKKIVPYSYIPFGYGPRSCIGSRFALLQIKIAVVEVFKEYKTVITPKTKIPLDCNKGDFSPLPKDGVWIGITKRKADNRN